MNRAQAILFGIFLQYSAAAAFFNFETAPVHPLALSPGGGLIAACNLPDGQVELFDSSNEKVVRKLSIPVGMDPVSLRFRSEIELWVVNALSDSINVIDLRNFAVSRVISTRPRPADVVFAGSPQRAFVSCPLDNIVQVFDLDTGALITTIKIDAERPKALSVSPDGSKVYAAIFESGNGTTILAPKITALGHSPLAGPADYAFGPYSGANPPPNRGTNLYPILSTNLPASNAPPRVGMIVKRQPDGRWVDDNNGDWTEMVSGTNAPFTGRVPGWNLLDHDVAVIDANRFEVSFIDRLMNICMDVTVNPKTGRVAVIGTDALNHIRYEPILKAVFTRAHLALIDESNLAQPQIVDLNAHLDYSQSSIPVEKRRATLGDPRGAAWNSDGTRLYVTGAGSDNLVMFDNSGKRLAVSHDLPEGPVGVVFDSARNRLYVLSRFAAAVIVLDAATLSIQQTIRFFDPTPEVIRKGRRHFYNTRKSSGLGQASCASCHVDGRFDRLSWDLGTPEGDLTSITANSHNFVASDPTLESPFHPMKGPMVTQTLQDIIGHEPFHWRGDRAGLEEFNPTFVNLQGADAKLTDTEMQEFEDFLATIRFPPNRLRGFDNSLPRSLPLSDNPALGRGRQVKGQNLPNGNAATGLSLFGVTGLICTQCHTTPTGNGPDRVFRNSRWTTIPAGTKGEHHLAVAAVPRSEDLPFKVAQLRSLPEKLGFNLNGPSRAGFGFFHDGRADSLTRFLQDGFALTDDNQTADLIAFLLAFSGSDLPNNNGSTSATVAPGVTGLDAPAAMGLQLLATSDSPDLDRFLGRANSSTGRLDLVVFTRLHGANRGWLYQPLSRQFKADSIEEPSLTRTELFSTNEALLFMLVPKGSGERLALDRDSDGIFNYDEILAGSDPADPNSTPAPVRIVSVGAESGQFAIIWSSPVSRRYNLLTKARLEHQWTPLETGTTAATLTTNALSVQTGAQAYFRVEVLPP